MTKLPLSGNTGTNQTNLVDQKGYVYYVRGIRKITDQSGAVSTKDDYYPFGLQMEGLVYNGGNLNSHLKYNGKELDEELNLHKYHFGWRDYDPELARWFVVDPARQFASPYVFGNNNPICGYDIDGQFFAFDDLFLVMAIFGTTNLTIDAINGDINNFEDGLNSFGTGALQGGISYFTGGMTPDGGMAWGKYLGNAGLRALSSQLPSIQIGYMSIGPSFMMGTDGLRAGVDINVSMRFGDIYLNFGESVVNNEIGIGTGFSGMETRRSLGISYNSGSSIYSMGLNRFDNEDYFQNTMMLRYSDNNFSFMYENDHFVGRDQDRTAAFEMSIRAGDVWFTQGIRLATGQTIKGSTITRDGIAYYDNPGIWDHLEGIEYFGIRYNNQNLQVGTNTEGGRNRWQNIGVHRIINKPYIPMNPDKKDRYYFNYSNYSPHSLY